MYPPVLQIYNDPLTVHDKPIKYLGYYLSFNLNTNYYINYIIKKASFAFHTLRLALKCVKHVQIKSYFVIIQSCIISILHYCNIFLLNSTKKEINIINIFYHKLLRYSWCCGSCTIDDCTFLQVNQVYIKMLDTSILHIGAEHTCTKNNQSII